MFVPRGAEARAVRRGVRRAHSSIRIVAHGIGPLAAGRAADAELGAGVFGTALSMGLCGLLSPAFREGDTLVYRELVREGGACLAIDAALHASLGAAIAGSQSGVRAFASDGILTTAEQKRAAAVRYEAGAVDMESFALVERLGRAGVTAAAVRVGSDAFDADLPELDRALDGSGGIDAFALGLAMLRAPLRAVRLVRGATRALAALERAAYRIALAA